MRVLWVTSCAADMWTASGQQLLKSFKTHDVIGTLLICAEGELAGLPQTDGNVIVQPIANDPFLVEWLESNKNFIPRDLGGSSPAICKCPGGPFNAHSKRHRMPCLAQWFNRNHSRWFRKIVSLRQALQLAHPTHLSWDYDVIIWIDSDCVFKRAIAEEVVQGWFKHGSNAVFYLKYKRPVIESGIVGYYVRNGANQVIQALIEIYESGAYRKLPRWDDSNTLQYVLFHNCQKLAKVDLAYGQGKHAGVVSHSALGPFIEHAKGKHRIARILT